LGKQEIWNKKSKKLEMRGKVEEDKKKCRGVCRMIKQGMKNDQEIAENNFQCPHCIIIQAWHDTSVPAGPHYYESHPLLKKTNPSITAQIFLIYF
jgi:hypothetical protein